MLLANQKLARTLPSTPKTWRQYGTTTTARQIAMELLCGKPKARSVLREGNLL